MLFVKRNFHRRGNSSPTKQSLEGVFLLNSDKTKDYLILRSLDLGLA